MYPMNWAKKLIMKEIAKMLELYDIVDHIEGSRKDKLIFYKDDKTLNITINMQV